MVVSSRRKGLDVTRVVSNTEVSSYSLCKRQHFYRFNMGIEPKPDLLSPALYRGIIGHQALEVYYMALKDEATVDEAKKLAIDTVKAEIMRVSISTPEEYDRIILLTELSGLIEAYAEYYRNEKFKIIAVEKEFQTPISDDILYGMKLDLLIQHVQGPYRGDYELIDHKFVYNFKSVRELELDGQMPKYIKTLKSNGITIGKGCFNQVRYRKMKDPKPSDIFKRTPARLFPYKTEAIWNEQKKYADKIVNSPEEPLRTLTTISCRGCYFDEVCNADLMGQNTENLLSTRYQPTTYGYVDLGAEE